MIVRELLTRLGFTIDDAKLKNYEARAHRATESFSAMSGVFGAVIAGMAAVGVGQIARISDEWSNMESRIGLVTKSAEEQAKVTEEIYQISNRTRQETTATGSLYTKMARAGKDWGASNEELLGVTETVNQALVVGGASTAEANSTILQLGQALGSGRLQGDELRSLAENAPTLMDEIAKAYGVTVGALKQLGADGKLTSEGVFKAILKGKEKISADFKKMPLTIGQAVTVSGNRIGELLRKINEETGVFRVAAQAIFEVAERVEAKLEGMAIRAGGWGNLLKAAGLAIAAVFAGPLVHGIRFATLAMLNFFKTALLNPWTWVLLGIILLLDDLYTWLQGGDSIIGDFLGSFEDFQASDTFAMLMDSLRALQALWDAIFPSLQAVGIATFNTLRAVVRAVFGTIVALVMAVVKLFAGDFRGAVGSLGDTLGSFADIFGALFDGAINIVGNLLDLLAALTGAVVLSFVDDDTLAGLEDSLQSIYEIGEAVFPALQEVGSAAFGLLQNSVETLFGVFSNLILGVSRLFSGDLSGAVSAFADSAKIWLDGVLNAISGIWNVAKGLINTLTSFGGATVNLVARGGVSAQSIAAGGGGAPQVVVENNVNVAGVPNASVSTETDTSVGGGPPMTDYDFTGGD